MWKRLTATMIVVALLPGFRALAADPPTGLPAPVSKEDVRKAIDTFQRDPLHLPNPGIRLSIMQFAEDNPGIRVVIGPKPVPWLANKKVSDEVRASLLTAYLAGNVKSQLDHGAAKNDSVAGCEQVIATYLQLQKADPGLSMPEIEKLIGLQKQGKLAAYLADAETATSTD